MAIVNLSASRPGAYTKEGLMVGNPEAVANINGALAAAPAWTGPSITVAVGAEKRLLTVVTDTEIEIIQVSTSETPATANGQPMRIPVATGARTGYGCFLHPATVGVYVRTP